MFSALKRFDGRWALSGRWSKSFDRLSSQYRELLSLGSLSLNPFGRPSDILGLGIFAGDPSDTSAGTEHGMEIFYRLQLTQALNIMPDLQYWKRNGNTTSRTDAWVAGIRINFDY
jgi:carbohydrate-selective porin OprB